MHIPAPPPPSTPSPLARPLATLLIATAALVAGCDDQPSPVPRRARAGQPTPQPTGTAESGIADLSPIETIHLLRDYRASGRYSKIEPFLLPEQRSLVIAHLRAVDRLVVATRLLRNRVREQMGTAAAQSFARYAQVGNIVGVFSTDAELLDEHLHQDRARVSFQIDDRIPLESVEMIRNTDRWVLVADPVPGVPEQLIRLAFLLERMADRAAQGNITSDELHHDIALRQSPIMRRLKKLISQAAATHPPPPPDQV